MFARDEDILKAAEDWRKAGRGVALATVMETWGSAPRPVGSNLVIDNEGNFLGSVSGGCVEGAVVTEAIDVIDSGKPKMLEFGVADETAWKVGLSCGGTIRVYVEKVIQVKARRILAGAALLAPPRRRNRVCHRAGVIAFRIASLRSTSGMTREERSVKLDILHTLNTERAARRAVVVVTDVESGAQRLVKAADVARDPLHETIEKRLRMGKSGMEETAQGRVFLTVHVPSPRLGDHRRGAYQSGAGADGRDARL